MLFCMGVVLPVTTWGVESNVSASASARITLRIPSRVQLRQTDNPASDQLCVSRIPASSYYLTVWDMGTQAEKPKRLSGQPGNHCIQVSASREGKMVLIVAE
ncbi:hypothetical protein [Microbulbifer magnicolonia]|uniref:hypothetical protein n=1 Tax=Microbulbifer magnicolonia TaxID=3109744 RepID=UPI002B417174|nr:hypothetical protein [Microbulbifer sp. GG15]